MFQSQLYFLRQRWVKPQWVDPRNHFFLLNIHVHGLGNNYNLNSRSTYFLSPGALSQDLPTTALRFVKLHFPRAKDNLFKTTRSRRNTQGAATTHKRGHTEGPTEAAELALVLASQLICPHIYCQLYGTIMHRKKKKKSVSVCVAEESEGM